MTESKPGPLDGVKILDLSTVLLGPYAGQIMGDLGADVIRVESPQSDVTRWSGDATAPGFGHLFLNANRNKRSLCLDLKQDDAKKILTELIMIPMCCCTIYALKVLSALALVMKP